MTHDEWLAQTQIAQTALVLQLEADAAELVEAICAGCDVTKPCRKRPVVGDSGVYTGFVCDECFDPCRAAGQCDGGCCCGCGMPGSYDCYDGDQD